MQGMSQRTWSLLHKMSWLYISSKTQETNLLKTKEKELLKDLVQLQSQQASMGDMENIDDTILEYCKRVSSNLDSFIFDEKQLLFDALEMKVFAYRDHTELCGVLPSYVTIEQTSGSMLSHNKNRRSRIFVKPQFINRL